jgi:uncharacterized membrane protein YeaQ/YmgE (transglycosylase-associated protein family)
VLDTHNKTGEQVAMDGGTAAGAGGTAILILIVMFAVSGLIVGALARLALPGRDDMSYMKTIGYGLAGSLLGGLVSTGLGVQNRIVSLIIAVAVAAGLIWFFTRRKPKV